MDINQHKSMAMGKKLESTPKAIVAYKKGGHVVKDVETKSEMKKYGKEGSKKEEAHDKTENMKKGGKVIPIPVPMPVAARRPMAPPVAMPVGLKKGGSAMKKGGKC